MNKKLVILAVIASLAGCANNPPAGEGQQDDSLREAAIAAALTPGVSKWCVGAFGFEGCVKKDRTIDVPQLKALIGYLEVKGVITSTGSEQDSEEDAPTN